MTVTIRQESFDDVQLIHEIHQRAFGKEDEAKLVDLLRRSDAFIPELSLVAMTDNRAAGHILFTRIRIVNSQDAINDSLALAPMSVLPAFQRQGIGSRLIHHGLGIARVLGFNSIIVLGHPHYYSRFGFVPAARWNIHCPYDVPSEVFMALELLPGSLRRVQGMVQYDEAFASMSNDNNDQVEDQSSI